jgi:tetratricopeptide (TPR) repeat protein
MAEQLGDQRLLGRVLPPKTLHHLAYMRCREAVDAGQRAVELLRSPGNLWLLADALWETQWTLVLLGRLDGAAELGGQAEALAARLGHLGALVATGRAQALRQFMLTGDIAKYKEFARADLELCRAAGIAWISLSYTFSGLAHFWGGQWQEALEDLQQAAKLEPPGFWAGGDWGYLFLGKAYAGDKDSALAMLEERRDKLPRPGQANTVGAWMMLLAVAEGLAVLGEGDEAAKLYPIVLESTDTGALIRWPDTRLFQAVAGMAAAAGGEWGKAEEHYQTALRQAHELPNQIEQPEVRRWYAHMLIDRDAPGDHDKARKLLTEAIAMYRRIGMPKHVEMAEALLRQTGSAA